MSFNLVDIVKEQIENKAIGYISDMLGGDSHKGKSLLEGAIPALLGGVAHIGSNPTGAKSIFETLKNTDDSILDSLDSHKPDSLIDMGTKMLGSVFGGNNSSILGNIISSVAGYSGTDHSTAKSAMGFLAPLIFGVLKRKFLSSEGFGVDSLVDLFRGQKENITKSLPSGLKLNFDSLNDTASSASYAAHEAAREVKHEGKSFLSKLLPLLLLLAAGWLAYNFFMKRGASTIEHQTTTTTEVDVNNLGANIQNTMSGLVSTLANVKDEASAKEALPTLDNAVSNLGTYANMMNKLPASVQNQVKNYIAQYIPQLKDLLGKIGSIPGVSDIIRPVIEKLSQTLALFQ